MSLQNCQISLASFVILNQKWFPNLQRQRPQSLHKPLCVSPGRKNGDLSHQKMNQSLAKNPTPKHHWGTVHPLNADWYRGPSKNGPKSPPKHRSLVTTIFHNFCVTKNVAKMSPKFNANWPRGPSKRTQITSIEHIFNFRIKVCTNFCVNLPTKLELMNSTSWLWTNFAPNFPSFGHASIKAQKFCVWWKFSTWTLPSSVGSSQTLHLSHVDS